MKANSKQYIIEVEVCTNCHLHAWCSRHEEGKYNQFYEHFKTKSQQLSNEVIVLKNNIPASFKKLGEKTHTGQNRYLDLSCNQIATFPRLGAFQIYFNKQLIFSKLKSGLWPHIDRIVHLVQTIIKSHRNGEDISKYSLDYRIKNDQTQYFLETYKAQIVRQLGSARKRAISLQKIGENSGSKNFKSRKIITRSKHKTRDQMTESSPIVNKSKFNQFQNNSQRPQSRDQHVYTKQLENDQKFDQSKQDDEVQVHKWSITKKNQSNKKKNIINEGNLSSPYSKKNDHEYLQKNKIFEIDQDKKQSTVSKKLTKLNGAKIKINAQKLKKNEQNLKKSLDNVQIIEQKSKQKNSDKKQKIDSNINGWSMNQAGTQQLPQSSKNDKKQLKASQKQTKKPSIRQNLEFPSNQQIIENDKSKTGKSLQSQNKEKISSTQQKGKNKVEKSQKLNQSDILKSEKSNYDDEYFEEAQSEISWQPDRIYERYKDTLNWIAVTQKSQGKIPRFQLKQQSKQKKVEAVIDRSQIIKKPQKQEKLSQKLSQSKKQSPQKPMEKMEWVAICEKKKFNIYKSNEYKPNNRADDVEEEYSMVDQFGIDDEVVHIKNEEEDYQDLLNQIEESHDQHTKDNYKIKVNQVHDLDSQSAGKSSLRNSKKLGDVLQQFEPISWHADYKDKTWRLSNSVKQQIAKRQSNTANKSQKISSQLQTKLQNKAQNKSQNKKQSKVQNKTQNKPQSKQTQSQNKQPSEKIAKVEEKVQQIKNQQKPQEPKIDKDKKQTIEWATDYKNKQFQIKQKTGESKQTVQKKAENKPAEIPNKKPSEQIAKVQPKLQEAKVETKGEKSKNENYQWVAEFKNKQFQLKEKIENQQLVQKKTQDKLISDQKKPSEQVIKIEQKAQQTKTDKEKKQNYDWIAQYKNKQFEIKEKTVENKQSH